MGGFFTVKNCDRCNIHLGGACRTLICRKAAMMALRLKGLSQPDRSGRGWFSQSSHSSRLVLRIVVPLGFPAVSTASMPSFSHAAGACRVTAVTGGEA